MATTMMEIEEAIKSIETHKQSLKQSFDLLLQHSHSFSSFSLSWSHIDSHFSLIQSSLHSRFSLLQQNHPSLPQFHPQNPENGQNIQSERTPDGENPTHGEKIQSLSELERTLDGENPTNGQKNQSLPQLERTPDGENPSNGQKNQSLPVSKRTSDGENPTNGQKNQSLPVSKRTSDGINPTNGQKIQSLPQLEQTPDGENPTNGQKNQSLTVSERTSDGKNSKNGPKEQSLFKLEKNEEDPDDKNPQNELLKSVCEEMDSKELRRLVKNCLELRGWGASELSQALKHAPDPYKLVLDSTEEVIRRGLSSVILLESLMMIEGVEVSEEMRNRAKCMAIKWKDKLVKNERFLLDAMSLLCLLGVFKLFNDFDKDDVLELLHLTSKNVRTLNLCRILGLEDRVPELVQKLIGNKKELIAIRFVQEFKLGDQFSCVLLLKSYLKECQYTATQLRLNKKNDPRAMIDGDEKEKAALAIVIRYIKDYKLELEFSPQSLEQRLKKLEKLRDKRRTKKMNRARELNEMAPQHYLQPPVFAVGPSPGVGPLSIGPYWIPGPIPNGPHGLSGSFTVGAQLHGLGSQVPSSSSHFVDAYGFPHHQPNHPQ